MYYFIGVVLNEAGREKLSSIADSGSEAVFLKSVPIGCILCVFFLYVLDFHQTA